MATEKRDLRQELQKAEREIEELKEESLHLHSGTFVHDHIDLMIEMLCNN